VSVGTVLEEHTIKILPNLRFQLAANEIRLDITSTVLEWRPSISNSCIFNLLSPSHLPQGEIARIIAYLIHLVDTQHQPPGEIGRELQRNV